ncbi:uncharacterized protein LOC131538154 isoform X2 [Onychostoma macrolepis]|uniref:Integrase core domain-containing protein n=1 Tax=Onychostoma macrolepis TaxID=369639 RepID=A0A7J6D700_9TELE|nr:uncharacterized protein LOC131538154 isoform X2 [Onychostoma macrolepis]KAF4115037.1 hypothetical protein G5714_002526 [Onychostoma macrolepis]
MKGWLCTLLLLESFVFVVQQQVDGGLAENEISQQLSNEDRRQNPPQTDSLRDEASTDSQQYCHLSFPDIHAALRELTATVTEQKANIRVLETQLREELNKKTDAVTCRFYSVLHQLEEDGLLDLSSSVLLFCCHHVFIPRLQSQLDLFRDGWDNHPLSTERNLTPNQLWHMGLQHNSEENNVEVNICEL